MPAHNNPVQFSGYTNFGGAYSPGGANFVLFSSMTDVNDGLHGLEIVVHEGMHQWDGQMSAALTGPARAFNVAVPRDLTHAVMFFTTGEAVRRIDPAYVPVADCPY